MSETSAAYSRTRPFPAAIRENRLLSRPGSAKETRHLVVDLEGSGLAYHVGDSLGVCPANPPGLVEEVAGLLGLDLDAAVEDTSLREALARRYILNRVSKKFVKAVLARLPAGAARDRLESVCAGEDALEAYVWDRDFVDVLREHPGVAFTAGELAGTMLRLNPRLYSIASSPAAHPAEVHLTVAVVRYESHGRPKQGVASGFLAGCRPGGAGTVPVYVQHTRHFHLPPDGSTPIILVGPGTGIAPFRAFLQERAALGHTGRNWLFFGDQHRATDFLYEEELLGWRDGGLLTRLDLAFSRDQSHKVYVQHRMLEAGAELWSWLQDGAWFYVCGDARRMARDVHAALVEIARVHGGLTPEKAAEHVEVTLARTEKRYLKDVY